MLKAMNGDEIVVGQEYLTVGGDTILITEVSSGLLGGAVRVRCDVLTNKLKNDEFNVRHCFNAGGTIWYVGLGIYDGMDNILEFPWHIASSAAPFVIKGIRTGLSKLKELEATYAS